MHVWRWRGPRGDSRVDALLASYLGVSPAQLRWTIGHHGKPALAGESLAMNWSHCDGELLLAVAEGTAIGVDLEMPRALRRRQALLERAFTTRERDALKHADDVVVLRAWAYKEALVKAIGRGIAYGLNRIELDLRDPLAPRLAALTGPAAPAGAWHVQALPQRDDALAAVAWRGGPRTVRQFFLDDATAGTDSSSSLERTWR